MIAKSKLNSIKFLISKALVDSNISNDEFALINNVLEQYDNIKEETNFIKSILLKILKTEDFSQFIKECHHIV